MPGFSTAKATDVLNHELRTGTNGKRGANYLSLHTGDPTDAGLTTLEFPFANGYARVLLAMADATWTAPAVVGGIVQVANAINIVFPDPSGDWASAAPATHFGIWTASTAGIMIFSGVIGTPRPVTQLDNAPTFAAGAFIIQLQ